ncbi:MAG: hypothetical protein Ct9H300mP11_14350 [Chloroflexota bacterium]|nr:MAG: hypothetical protein Ct9H300mP11_14350 [Chloroflexota bacterium]
MGVPAHDSRVFIFAQKYKLPIRTVIAPIEGKRERSWRSLLRQGFMTNSGAYDGMTNEECKTPIAIDLEKRSWGGAQFRSGLRLVNLASEVLGYPDSKGLLRHLGGVSCSKIRPAGILPKGCRLHSHWRVPGLPANEDFVKPVCPKCNASARRKTAHYGTFMDSSWYMMRYLDPHKLLTRLTRSY